MGWCGILLLCSLGIAMITGEKFQVGKLSARSLLSMDCSENSRVCRKLDPSCVQKYCYDDEGDKLPDKECFLSNFAVLLDTSDGKDKPVFYDIEGVLYYYIRQGEFSYLERISAVHLTIERDGNIVKPTIYRSFEAPFVLNQFAKVSRMYRLAKEDKLRKEKDESSSPRIDGEKNMVAETPANMIEMTTAVPKVHRIIEDEIAATTDAPPLVSPTDSPLVSPTDSPLVSPTDSPLVSPTDSPRKIHAPRKTLKVKAELYKSSFPADRFELQFHDEESNRSQFLDFETGEVFTVQIISDESSFDSSTAAPRKILKILQSEFQSQFPDDRFQLLDYNFDERISELEDLKTGEEISVHIIFDDEDPVSIADFHDKMQKSKVNKKSRFVSGNKKSRFVSGNKKSRFGSGNKKSRFGSGNKKSRFGSGNTKSRFGPGKKPRFGSEEFRYDLDNPIINSLDEDDDWYDKSTREDYYDWNSNSRRQMSYNNEMSRYLETARLGERKNSEDGKVLLKSANVKEIQQMCKQSDEYFPRYNDLRRYYVCFRDRTIELRSCERYEVFSDSSESCVYNSKT